MNLQKIFLIITRFWHHFSKILRYLTLRYFSFLRKGDLQYFLISLPPPRAFSYHRLQIRCSVQEGVEKLLILVLRLVVDLGGSLLKWKSAAGMLF